MGQDARNKSIADEELMISFVKGAEEAFDELVERYVGKITNFIHRQVANFATAEELAQDTFVAVYRKKHTFRGGHRFSSWLYKIALNMCRMHFRKVRSSPAMLSIDRSREEGGIGLDKVLVDDGEGPLEALSRKDAQESLEQAILSLPIKQRQVFTLSFYEGMAYEEIADLLGCSPGTVASRKHAAVKKLASRLKRLRPGRGPQVARYIGEDELPNC